MKESIIKSFAASRLYHARKLLSETIDATFDFGRDKFSVHILSFPSEKRFFKYLRFFLNGTKRVIA